MEKGKIYALMITLLIVSQIFGLYGGFLQAPRIIAVLFLPVLLKNLFKLDRRDNFYFNYFFIYLLFGLISFFYAFDVIEVVKDLSYSLINLVIFAEIVVFSKLIPHSSYRVILRSYVLFIGLTIPIAFVEIFFDLHFSNSKLGENALIGGIGELKRYAAVTYTNYNLYNHILILGMPFVLGMLKLQNKIFNKIFLGLLILSILYITTINGSRATFVAMIILLFVYFQFFHFNSRKLFLVSSVLTLAILSSSYFLFLDGDGFNYLILRLESKGFEDSNRMDLISYGIDMFLNSYGFGVGPGNFESYMERYSNLSIKVPHNLFIEIISQSGFVVFLFFLNFLFNIYKNITKPNRLILILSFLSVPMAFIVNSVYLSNPYMWIYFASLFVISNNLFKTVENG